jgi:hypothetical protein
VEGGPCSYRRDAALREAFLGLVRGPSGELEVIRMEGAGGAIIVAVVTLAFNLFIPVFGGGWRLSGRISSMESSMKAMQESVVSAQEEIKEFGEILVKMKSSTLG